MSTLPVQAISSFARGGVKALTRLAISTATQSLSRALDNRVFEGPRLESFHLQTSRDGAPMPRVFGRVRLAGQVIWASQVREITEDQTVNGKGGGPTQRDYRYTISFAVGLCEGEIIGVDRIWANGEVLPLSNLTIRVHKGNETQNPDPVIAATEPGPVPAFRGTAYIVFEDFPLDEYGNRLPSINVEIIRGVEHSGRMEGLIQSVNLLPGTGEFALAPDIIEEIPAPGVTKPSNMNNFSGQADLLTSLDQLQRELPNCRHVNIISAWFGSSLDAGECLIQPGAERSDRKLLEAEWKVGGFERDTAYIISADSEGRPNYGGTPSDDSLIACIAELKRRGFAVTLYPFLLMDMPGFPWRGRITAQTVEDVDAFFGSDEDMRFRHHILHHARLAQQAGGVNGFIIGSELKALTAFRMGDDFPAVTKMRNLAAAVRGIVGGATKITYAADWSDYFGLQEGDDRYYHLDPLWADANIDAVGIDAYFPLSDWREGEHLDALDSPSLYDLDYLKGNVEGGEGYDWFYASASDRQSQIRTAITDPDYRYKDMRHWWASAHTERRDGVLTTQSPWQPRSKPVWLLELGCPAVNKGANEPNVFYDPKSVDAALPYFSAGSRDDLIQRRYIEAFLSHYAETNEPGFIDLTRASVWAWDARPYPDFPSRDDVWSDGVNWSLGHWLNGRAGLMSVADVIEELARDSGLTDIDVTGVSGIVPGYIVDRPMSAQQALAPLLRLFDFELNERGGKVVVSSATREIGSIDLNARVKGPVRRTRADPETLIRDVRLSYLDAARDYQLATASARQLEAESVAVADFTVPAALDEGFARHVAERELSAIHEGQEAVRFSLSLSEGLQAEVGDRFWLENTVWSIEEMTIGKTVEISARRRGAALNPWVAGVTPERTDIRPYAGAAQLLAFDLPDRQGITVGALLEPFSPVTVQTRSEDASLSSPLRLGATLSDFPSGSVHIWDQGKALDVFLPGLTLSGVTETALLEGGNRFAVETELGWEIFAARDAVLTAPQTYRLSHFLRGLEGSEAFMADILPSGSRLLWLKSGLTTLPLSDDWRGNEVIVSGSTAERPSRDVSLKWDNLADLPMSPVHLKWDGQALSWVGRDRDFIDWTEETEHLRYRLRLFQGESMEEHDLTKSFFLTTPFDRAELVQLGPNGRESLFPTTLNVAA